jgi:hypothetical protein
MVTVHFLRTDGREVHKAGPFPWLRAVDGSLRAGPNGEEVARYVGGVWNWENVSAPKYVLHGTTCTLRFEGENPDDSTALGPLDRVEVVDGAVYAHPGRRLLARLDEEKKAWYAYEDKRYWPSLLVEKC